MDNDKIYTLLEKMYLEFSNRFEKIDSRFEKIEKELADFKSETREEFLKVNQSLARIETDHGNKLSALFDGYKLHSEQLNRIEEKVSAHE